MFINGNKLDRAKFKERSRSRTRARNRLGVIADDLRKPQIYRNPFLNKIDRYYQSTQYDHLTDWQTMQESDGEILSRHAKPQLIFPMLKMFCDRISSKLLGEDKYPDVSVEGDPEFQYFLELLEREILIKPKIQSFLVKLPIMGSAFVRTKISNGSPDIEVYDSKFCYPKFDEASKLIEVEIKYLWEDEDDLDDSNKPIVKWSKMILGQEVDIFFDSPPYDADHEPVFEEESRNEHNLGFVQGTWFRTSFQKHSPDGQTFVSEAFLSFLDDFNYNLSKTSGASEYGIDPQLIFSGMTEDEMEDMIKSRYEAWSLGREGQANFLETGGGGIASANEFRQGHLFKAVMNVARVAILDPEKIVGNAQSAKAMEVMHGPMIDFVNELRPYVGAGLKELYLKISLSMIIMNSRGFDLAFDLPPQYRPKSIDLIFTWPPIFPMTAQDKQQTISYVNQMVQANIISRETGLRWIMAMMPEIPVEDIELETQKINTQPQLGFGGFF